MARRVRAVRTATRLGPVEPAATTTAALAAALWGASTGNNPAMLGRATAALDERIGRALAVLRICCAEGRDWPAVGGGEGR